jgi:hypothetical protein
MYRKSKNFQRMKKFLQIDCSFTEQRKQDNYSYLLSELSKTVFFIFRKDNQK